jgi:glycosyltransferase involved in cell wall biosynthesis
MDSSVDPRFGIDARWLTAGPPSGRNYVRHLVAELEAGADRQDYVAFVRKSAERGTRTTLRTVRIPSLPSVLFNTVGIPMRLPPSVRAVAFQNFTPAVSRAKAVTVLHDLIFMTHPEQFKRTERWYLGLISRLLPSATVVAAVSEHVRLAVLERWPQRDPQSVVVAPNGVDEVLLEAGRQESDLAVDREVRLRHGVARPYILYLGRINVRKNLSGLIQAFAHARLPDHELVLAGALDGVTEDITGRAAQLGIGARVKQLDEVPAKDLPALLRGADAFAYVSFDEGFGVPPLEAMAFGVPVICSRIPALLETAAPGGALMVSPNDAAEIADALERAVSDQSVRKAARDLGPRQAARYRWRNTAVAIRGALETAAG